MGVKKNKRGQNEGSIRQRPDGVWEARYIIGRKPDGKPDRKSIYGKTRKEVQERLTKILNDLNGGKHVEPSKTTVGDWMDTWLKEYKKNSISDTTYCNYEQHARVHIKPHLGTLRLKDLKTKQIQEFYNDRFANGRQPIIKKKNTGTEIVPPENKGLSAATIHKIHNVLHEALDQCVKNKLIPANPSEATILPKIEKKPKKTMTVAEQQAFMDALESEKLGTLLRLTLGTGLRRGELLALTWDDVDLEKGTLRVDEGLLRIRDPHAPEGKAKSRLDVHGPKTPNSYRLVYMPSDLLEELKKHKVQQDKDIEELADRGISKYYDKFRLVFCTEIGKPIEPRNVLRTVYRICSDLGIKRINVHTLRHTAATRLLECGVDLITLMSLLGHTNLNTTKEYTFIFDKTKKEAAEKLNFLFQKEKAKDPEGKDISDPKE